MPRALTALILFSACASVSETPGPGVDTGAATDTGPAGDTSTGQAPTRAADTGPAPDLLLPDALMSQDIAAADSVAASQDTPVSDCPCEATQHCYNGFCRDNICLPGQSTCASLTRRLVCDELGASVTETPCPADTVCFLGSCAAPICSPEDPPFCDNGVRMVCSGLGTEYVPVPCPAGTGCAGGECLVAKPNVVLIMDTSGSMSLLSADPNTYPSECQGEPGCPQWSFPMCDDPSSPLTRLGRTKVALSQIITSQAASKVRLALQRFAQRGHSFPNCKQGHYQSGGIITGDVGKHEVSLGWFLPNLHEIMAVPFQPLSTDSDTAAMLSWVDFEESVYQPEPIADCVHPFHCDSNICLDTGTAPDGISGYCYAHDNPELRGIGPTPLGRSLFYAAEYLRLLVLVEGKTCQSTADCGSANYTCVEGACHDPLHGCRPNSVVLFTDGEETINTEPTGFFHPVVQAKRLQYGLGCTASTQCAGGASCDTDLGICLPPPEDAPQSLCKGIDISCESDSDCPETFCGQSEPCPGECLHFVTPGAKSATGHNVLKDFNGDPLSITVNVVDATGFSLDNYAVASFGGGAHVPVSFQDSAALAAELLQLLDAKQGINCGP